MLIPVSKKGEREMFFRILKNDLKRQELTNLEKLQLSKEMISIHQLIVKSILFFGSTYNLNEVIICIIQDLEIYNLTYIIMACKKKCGK